MLQLERKKVDEKNVICLVSIFPSLVLVLKFEQFKKSFFCNFVMILARNLTLLKQLRYMHLEVLITLFQKMILFTGVWATVHEILAIKISKKMQLNRNLIKSSTLNLHISVTVSHSIINNIIFWKSTPREKWQS